MSATPTTAEGGAAPQAPGEADGDGREPGRPVELPKGFAEAVVAAVREQEAFGRNPLVAASLSLGWYVAALAHPGEVSATSAALRGELLGASALSEPEALAFCCSHVEVALAKLKGVLDDAGLSAPELEQLRGAVDGLDPEPRSGAAASFDAQALAVLSAAEFRLGKAYGVGRELLRLTTRRAPGASLREHVEQASVARLASAVDDLASALPPHAGHSVRASLEEWRDSIGEDDVAPDTPETWRLLARQGELWRALLAGEKSGPDMLEIDDYLEAASNLSVRMRRLAGAFLLRFWWLALLVVALFGGGVALMVATDSGETAAAGAGGIIAALGLSWRGIGGALGGLAAQLHRPLWGAEIDRAVTRSITLLKRRRGRDASGHRRALALAQGEAGAPQAR